MFKRGSESFPENSLQRKELTSYNELNFPLPDLFTINSFSQRLVCFRDEGDFMVLFLDVLVKVLPEFNHLDVFTVCQHFKIPLSECNPAQMKCLKLYGVLLKEVDCSFLISLHNLKLLHRRIANIADLGEKLPLKLRVYHDCLGRCDGFFIIEYHLSEHAPCICCEVCSEVMSPREFVCHTHIAEEDLMYRQDFHPDNWWEYIQVHESFKPKFLEKRMLNELKFRFWDFSRLFQTYAKGYEQQGIYLTHAKVVSPLTNNSAIDLSNHNLLSDKK